jgi:type IV pilus assembly protein PilM
MALFGKKSGDSSSGQTTDTAKRGFGLGRKKADDKPVVPDTTGLNVPASGTNGGFEDFSDFSDTSAAVAAPPATKTKVDKTKPARPRVLSGTSVGLNIGNDSIKVVELQAKGSEIAVTAMGMVPTPAESISNGVVMSVNALQFAVRDALKAAGIKSKGVTISVAGTGALVVRVIEVPRMSDADLAKNMQIDADRYIPFPPSEVVMDFKALRELPSNPDAANMDVLLAAAQREIIDLHLKVIQEAKLDPRAIEVEPLAVARALTQSVTKQAQAADNGHASEEVDYSKVTAIINIGAAGTEISVLRGDILVFTRTVPNGGNTLTQSLVDYLGLPWHDAERVKHEWADALPPQSSGSVASPAVGTVTTGVDDWNDFGNFDEPEISTNTTNAPVAPSAQEAFGSGTGSVPQSGASQTGSTDPFDPDYFNQGPQGGAQQEPREQHGQKDPDDNKPSSSDFSGFNFADDDEAAAPAPSTTPAASGSNDLSDVEGTGATTVPAADPDPFTLPDESAAPADASSAFDFSLPETTEETSAPSGGGFNFGNFNFADDPATPDPASSAPVTAATDANPAESTPFDLALSDTQDDETVSGGAPGASAGSTSPADSPSAWNLGDLGVEEPAAAPASGDFPSFDLPANGNTSEAATTTENDFDIDSFFNSPGAETTAPVSGAGFGADDLSGFGVAAGTAAASGDLAGFGDDFTNFGAGLTGGATGNVDAGTVYSIMHPLLEELASEIRRSLEYHASRYPDAVVQNVVLVGGGARLRHIDDYLSQTLGIPTTIGDPTSRLTVRAPQLPEGYVAENAPAFAVAIGLGLRNLIS